MQFISYGVVTDVAPAEPGVAITPAQPMPSMVPSEDLVRPHPGSRPGGIDIDLPTGVRLSVDSYVNEKALARVLRALRQAP